MQKLQESVFSIVKTTNLSPAVFSFLQPSEDSSDKTPLGGILNDARHGWLALGHKFCIVDLKSGLKVAAKTFGAPYSNSRITVTSVIELPIPLTDNSKQLIISLCEDQTSIICIFHINGSQMLRCIQTDSVVTELAVCDEMPDGPLTSFDGIVMAGTRSGEIFAFDLNRAGLIQALKDISQGYEHLIQNENNPANLTFLPLNAIQYIEEQRDLALENCNHLALLLNETSLMDREYLFCNPDGTVHMKAKRDQVRVTVLQYIPQLGSLAVGYNFGAFQIWNILSLELEFTSQVNVECVPVTHFGFQEPCDDPRAFCYLWVVYSALERFEEEEFPLAVMYSLTYHGKRMLSDTKCLYQEFSMASIRFQVELTAMEDTRHLIGGKCVSCHTYSINSTLGSEGEESMLNICQLVWECWGETTNSSQYGMLLFDLDQWYKDQMPETYRLQNNPFMSATWCTELTGACLLDAHMSPSSVAAYTHCTRLEEHFYPNSLQYQCICLTTSESCVLGTVGIQRQIISSLDSTGPTALLNPTRLYRACLAAGLTPLYTYHQGRDPTQEEQRRFLLSVALEGRLSRLLKCCAHDWATGTHAGAGCTLPFLVDWCWQRAVELKENAKELTAPLFSSAALPDRNVVRCLEHCVQQLTQLTGLLDAILTKCCNLVVPDALSEMEEKYKGIGTVSLYFQVVQWFLRVGLLPERYDGFDAAPYPAEQLYAIYNKRRLKLQRLQDNSPIDDPPTKPCSLLYIDQLIENEFGGEKIHQMWIRGGSKCNGLYPPPSLYSLLRLYLLPDIAEEHKHSLVLYLLVDYSVLYDQVRYEAVIRRLMQFPTMFGLSNTAIKATQAFWHLDHRDFDFALDQLQCLTGNTLSEWQHNVVLSSLLAQRKTQAALQYLHVRKPAPIQIKEENSINKINDHDKLDDWQSCCSLYLARGLLFEALDVVRMCVHNAGSLDDKVQVLNFFFKGCRNSGQLSKILQVTLLPLEEEVFIKYLKNCNESQTSDILVMYYLQQARYIEAEQYNNKIRHSRVRGKEPSGSVESLADVLDRENIRDTIVEVACSSLPAVARSVRDFVLCDKDIEPHVIAPKPMSVFVQARSPKNTFTYKSSFIQDTIENASETWINKPKLKRGLKRALNVEETPFICTPKLNRHRSILADQLADATPPKRAKLDLNSTPKTPKFGSAVKLNETLSKQLSILLDMPEVQSPECIQYMERSGAETPHSILKTRRGDVSREAVSPVDSRYLGDSEDEILDTCSNHTHYSDSAKHLRFTIPTASESGSTPSPLTASALQQHETERENIESAVKVKDDTTATTDSHLIDQSHPLESPPKKLATEALVMTRKSYKDTVKARRSLSISANSSLSDDPNTSIESIADIPITLINPRYSAEKRKEERDIGKRDGSVVDTKETESVEKQSVEDDQASLEVSVPTTPRGRRAIRSIGGQSTPLTTRNRSRTPERKVLESPRLEAIIESPTKSSNTDPSSSPSRRSLRSRSRTPEVEIQAEQTRLASPRSLRSRAKTPEKVMSPKVEHSAKGKKSLSRIVLEANTFAKSKINLEQSEQEDTEPCEKRQSALECTPMKTIKQVQSLMDVTLSPIVNKSVLQSSTDSTLSETMVKETTKADNESIAEIGLKSLPAFTTIHEIDYEKSVLRSYQSSVADSSQSVRQDKMDVGDSSTNASLKSTPAFTTINELGLKSVLNSYESSIAEASHSIQEEIHTKMVEDSGLKQFASFTEIVEINIEKSVLRSCESTVAESSQEGDIPDIKDSNNSALKDISLITNDSDVEMKVEEVWKTNIDSQETASVIQKEKEKIVDIEREINELEGDMTDDTAGNDSTSGDEEIMEAPERDQSNDETSEESSAETSESDEEIISIQDTESDDTSDSEMRLRIDEDPMSSEGEKQDTGTNTEAETNAEIHIATTDKETPVEEAAQLDPLDNAQLSIMTDDNSVTESERSEMKKPDTSDVKEVTENVPMETEPSVQAIIAVQEVATTLDTENVGAIVSQDIDVIDTVTVKSTDNSGAAETKLELESNTDISVKTRQDVKEKDSEKVLHLKPNIEIEAKIMMQNEVACQKTKKETNIENKEIQIDLQKEQDTLEIEAKKESAISKSEQEMQPQKEMEDKPEAKVEEESKPAQRTRKRVKSSSSNQSMTEPKLEDIEPQTPVTRKRTQSNASNKSVEPEQKTPENDTSTTRRRAKTPTSTEVRKIITRRASKEISEKMDDSKEIQDDSIAATPKRRYSRVKSKNDDNESIASESSAISTRSKASEPIDIKPAPIRKGRKSILTTKPDLSVIPEMIVEEESKGTEDLIKDYSSSRRLTRHQKAVLESWLEPDSSPRASPLPRPSSRASPLPLPRPASRARRLSSRASDLSHDDDDASSTTSAFDVQPIDRISLLNKRDFEARLGRAASETKSTPKTVKSMRRMSVDVAESPDRGSPVVGSPARGRRASFNKACEALHTPKTRRQSTDTRKETESPQDSPAPSEAEGTPARRTRRAASTQSNTSQTKSDTGKRSRKTVLDESSKK
ncbi:unnamed protein product [Diatraea saccharalis]|uniref:Protein ELYS n=1 Tax=Diatraea saccharalis TaxID=40085 RepID=A0A9P0C762_9NEOP|nr:unnamed protein product [Diatraea saccharalis]